MSLHGIRRPSEPTKPVAIVPIAVSAVPKYSVNMNIKQIMKTFYIYELYESYVLYGVSREYHKHATL